MQRNALKKEHPSLFQLQIPRGDTTPIYQCTSPGGLLDDSTRENIAKEITRISLRRDRRPRVVRQRPIP